MRRRLWWQILVLETRAADERASEPLLLPDSFNVPLPCNLNDDDFGLESQDPLQGRNGPTDMTLCLLGIDATRTAQRMRPRSIVDGKTCPSFEKREELVRDYAKRFESIYLTSCDFSKPRTKVLSTVGYYWMYKLWLLLRYPLGQQISACPTPAHQGLQLATMLLRHNAILEHHSTSQNFAWFFRSYVPWHAIAVALTELCHEPRGTHADRAWNMIDPCFDAWSGRIGDSKSAMVWTNIKHLREKVQSLRQNSQDLDQESSRPRSLTTGNQAAANPSASSGLPAVNEGNDGIPFDWQLMGDFDLSDAALDLAFGSLPFSPMDKTVERNGVSASNPGNGDGTWENFMLNVHTSIPLE